MKRPCNFLLAMLLLAWGNPVASAQTTTWFSPTDAAALLQKTVGNWQVSRSVWHPEIQSKTTSPGLAKISPSAEQAGVHEKTELLLADGSTYKEGGFLRFSEESHQFEFMIKDTTTGKEVIVYKGNYYPEFKTLQLTGGLASKKQQSHISQWRYIFLDNGSFIKTVHHSDKNGNMHLQYQYHFSPAKAATVAIQ